MKRNAAEVAQQIKEVVPEHLHGNIDWQIDNASYKPPEAQQECFYMLTIYCNDLLEGEKPLVTEWKRKMVQILIERPLEENE